MFKFLKKKKERQSDINVERFWDFSYARKFLKEHENKIDLFELRMYNDRSVGEVFVENGKLVQELDGSYQEFQSRIDGTLYTKIDIPSIHVIYKDGKEKWLACYVKR